jgi:hypothetical protein
VAEAVEAAPHRPEGRRAAEAGAAAQAADEPAMPADGNVGPGRREAIENPDVGDRVPQEGAAQGEGAPAGDTAEGAPKKARKPRAKKAAPKKETEAAAPEAAAPEAAAPALAEAAPAEESPAPAEESPAPAEESPAPAEESPAPAEGIVDQDAANAAVDTAQDAAAAGAVEGAVANTDDDEKNEENGK